MKSTLRLLLEEFLPEDTILKIIKRSHEMNVSLSIKKNKGRWHRETLSKLVKERGNNCSYCNVEGKDEKLTLDHIIPKKVLLDLGLEDYYEDESNLDILCSRCNSRKASSLDFSNPKTIILFEKYINLYKERKIIK